MYDREWMVVSDSGLCISQKQAPNMCLISPQINLATGKLILHAPGEAFDSDCITVVRYSVYALEEG